MSFHTYFPFKKKKKSTIKVKYHLHAPLNWKLNTNCTLLDRYSLRISIRIRWITFEKIKIGIIASWYCRCTASQLYFIAICLANYLHFWYFYRYLVTISYYFINTFSDSRSVQDYVYMIIIVYDLVFQSSF